MLFLFLYDKVDDTMEQINETTMVVLTFLELKEALEKKVMCKYLSICIF